MPHNNGSFPVTYLGKFGMIFCPTLLDMMLLQQHHRNLRTVEKIRKNVFILLDSACGKNISSLINFVFDLSLLLQPQSQPITARCCFSMPPKNIRNPLGFLVFSGGIEKQHRAVMGQTKPENVKFQHQSNILITWSKNVYVTKYFLIELSLYQIGLCI